MSAPKFWWYIILFCLSINIARAKEPTIERGVLDLSAYMLTEQSIAIQGDSYFYWKKLTVNSPDTTGLLFQIPEIWNGDSLGTEKITRHGYGTYQFYLILPPGTAAQKTALGFGMPDIYCAYAVYVDDQKIGGNGIVARSKKDYKPYWSPQVLSFIPPKDTVLVSLQVANFSHSKGGIRETFVLGKAESLEKIFSDNRTYDFLLTGCLIMGGLFFLGLYFFGHKEYSMLLFSLFCLAYAYRIIGAKNYALHHLIEDIPWIVTVRLEYLTLFLSAGLFVAYSYHLYPAETARKFYLGFSVISILLCLLTIITPPVSCFPR